MSKIKHRRIKMSKKTYQKKRSIYYSTVKHAKTLKQNCLITDPHPHTFDIFISKFLSSNILFLSFLSFVISLASFFPFIILPFYHSFLPFRHRYFRRFIHRLFSISTFLFFDPIYVDRI